MEHEPVSDDELSENVVDEEADLQHLVAGLLKNMDRILMKPWMSLKFHAASASTAGEKQWLALALTSQEAHHMLSLYGDAHTHFEADLAEACRI
jgi:hypothetical protein